MNRTIKISLAIFGMLIVGVVAFIGFGLYLLEIEDTYGGNQDIFHYSRQGDLVVNRTTGEFGEIKKTWTRFYVVKQSDTLDIYEWWDDEGIEIYRLTDASVEQCSSYVKVEQLIKDGKIELKKKLR